MPSLRALPGSIAAALRDRGGNVALLFAVSAPMVIGGAGLATEVGYWYHRRLELQSAADAAAYAAAVDLRAGATQDSFNQQAVSAAASSGYDGSAGTITVNWPPQSGTHMNSQSIEVLISQTTPRLFSAIFSNTPIVENVRSVTTFQTASNACVLALNPSASGAALFSGSSILKLTGCSVMTNSLSPTGVTLDGSAQLTTDCVISVGGVSLGSGAHMSVCSTPITQAPPVADPFANVPAPPQAPCQPQPSGNVIPPGSYCGLDLKGTVTLSGGGPYVIQGDFNVNANANVSGQDVTIYMSGSGQVRMNGTATVTLDAPTSGTYAGILFMGDRNGPNIQQKFNGTAASRMTGAIYFPSQNVTYQGNFSGSNGCTQVVADTVTWIGNTTMKADCSDKGMRTLQAYQAVRFVE